MTQKNIKEINDIMRAGRKLKTYVNVEVCDNGVMVTLKKGKSVLGTRVFEGSSKVTTERWIKWSKNILKMNKK